MNGNDIIYSRAGNNILYGDAGNDISYGGTGSDTLYGGLGSYISRFSKGDMTGNAIDRIMDFNKLQNDKIDLSQLLEAYNPLTHAITDFVQITTSGVNSILKIDANGGGNSFVQIATLMNVAGLTDEVALKNSGHLIV